MMSLQASLPKDGGKKAYVEAMNVTMKANIVAIDILILSLFSMAFKYAKNIPNSISVRVKKDLAPFSCTSIIKEKIDKRKTKNEAKVKTLLSELLASAGLIKR
jgi:hypothetical protein